jgi:hypothetical protein
MRATQRCFAGPYADAKETGCLGPDLSHSWRSSRSGMRFTHCRASSTDLLCLALPSHFTSTVDLTCGGGCLLAFAPVSREGEYARRSPGPF